MPTKILSSTENNFTKGLVTEFTGLNFPENAATDCDNVAFTIIGEVNRRLGIDYEENFELETLDKTNKAINSYKWNNAGGDGLSELVVVQVGNILRFYRSSDATLSDPLSTQLLPSSITITAFQAVGNTNDPGVTECNFTDGNGYLFVFHPDLDPFYCTYENGAITGAAINVQVRDFNGILEVGVDVANRPNTLSPEHNYNLTNQGWIAGAPWSTNSSTTHTMSTGTKVFTVSAGLGALNGQHASLYVTNPPFGKPSGIAMSGTVIGYAGTSLTLLIDSVDNTYQNRDYSSWRIEAGNSGYIETWKAQIGNYPSNADVWWRFKNSANQFAPATTLNQVTIGSGPAPKGHYILNAFSQQRSLVSGIAGLTDVTTTVRPRTGTWFQGRVWYAGVDASQSATGDAQYYTWTENIYFSQIVVDTTQFSKCYQTNDPTSEELFDILPTDGGVITIQGCGSIYKLFPIQNGMLVFAANGVWFITGSQGIGFTATDYTITKISNIQSISSSSFVNVMGLPYFWNEEGIYQVGPVQGGGLQVEPITVSTILSFYENIPLNSKKYVKAAYNPIDYVIQWVYKSAEETDVTSRYDYDKILNYNVYNKAFFPYTVEGSPSINGIQYVAGPGGSGTPPPAFKYIASSPEEEFTFADEHDEDYVDWFSYDDEGENYTSYFITGYKVHGDALRKFGIQYLSVLSNSLDANAFQVQGIWDYWTDSNSGKFTVPQIINNTAGPAVRIRRVKIRGRGYVLQFKVTSIDGRPFDIIGWSMIEDQNQGT